MPRESITTSKSPEEWLASSETEPNRGRLKVFLGYAPGVGKTYSMLSEGIRRRRRGEDVVIGVVEAHGLRERLNWLRNWNSCPGSKSSIRKPSSMKWMLMPSSPALRRLF